MENNEIQCVQCGMVLTEFKETNVFNHYKEDGTVDKTLLIKNLPMLTCFNCDEEFFGADPMEKINELLNKISVLEGDYFIADYETGKVFKMTIAEEV